MNVTAINNKYLQHISSSFQKAMGQVRKNIFFKFFFNFALREAPKGVKFIEAASRIVVFRGCGEGAMGNYCLIGTKFLCGTMKRSRDGRWGWLHNRNVLNA